MIATRERTSVPLAGHKPRILRMPDWGAAGWAGLIAGAAFMAYELLLLPAVLGGNAWVPTRMVAAIVFGAQVLPPAPYFAAPTSPSSGVFLMALALHFSLSLAYARALSLFLYRLSTPRAVAAGAVCGLGLYFLNFHAFTAFFPWFAEARGLVTLAGNVLFGVCAAALYKAFETREPLIE
jgi:hypothetical protein